MNNNSKIVLVGAGLVGATTAFTLVQSGISKEIVLIDIDKERAEGEALDLSHGISFFPTSVKIKSGDYSDCKNAKIIIISAGANQKIGESRLDLVNKNTEIYKSIIPQITSYTKNCIIIVVTNPVDILTYVTLKISGLPEKQVIGSGTVLDTSRLRHMLSQELSVDARNIHGYVLGEHGDTEFVAWSKAHIGGVGLEEFFQINEESPLHNSVKEDITKEVRRAAYEVIERKGATYYAVALALNRICEAIIKNENALLTVSTLIKNFYDVENICLSIPCIINRDGIKKKIPIELSKKEIVEFQHSANTLKEITTKLNLELAMA